jgi:hypothetical protein
MLHYRGTRQWARLYAPEAMAGIYTNDEMEDLREVQGEVHGEAGEKIPTPRAGKSRKAPIETEVAKDATPTTPAADAPPASNVARTVPVYQEQSLADAVAGAMGQESPTTDKQEPAGTSLQGDLPTATMAEVEACVIQTVKAGYKAVLFQALKDWDLNEAGELAGATGSDRKDFIDKIKAMVQAAAKGTK